jgi:hypothetical protein
LDFGTVLAWHKARGKIVTTLGERRHRPAELMARNLGYPAP